MSVADDLIAAFQPVMSDDLEDYLTVIGDMFAEVELYAMDSDDGPGWSILLDPDRCPVEALPYLAQYVGETLPPGLPEAAMREWIKDAPNQQRGTVESIWKAGQRSLTGSRSVIIRQRTGVGGAADPDYLTVLTFTQETLDPAQVLRDLRDVVPADIVLIYQSVSGITWGDLQSGSPSWNTVKATHTDWQDVANDLPGDIYNRPGP